MKLQTLLLAATIGMMSLTVQARDQVEMVCEAQSALAESIMKYRQGDKPRGLADKVVTSEQGQIMLDWAYDLPLEKTYEQKKSSIEAFTEAVYSTCVGALTPDEIEVDINMI